MASFFVSPVKVASEFLPRLPASHGPRQRSRLASRCRKSDRTQSPLSSFPKRTNKGLQMSI